MPGTHATPDPEVQAQYTGGGVLMTANTITSDIPLYGDAVNPHPVEQDLYCMPGSTSTNVANDGSGTAPVHSLAPLDPRARAQTMIQGLPPLSTV
jgi:hypothetical protein